MGFGVIGLSTLSGVMIKPAPGPYKYRQILRIHDLSVKAVVLAITFFIDKLSAVGLLVCT